MTKRKLTGALVLFGLMTFVCTATAAPPLTDANRHCVVKLEPAGSDASQLSTPAEPECYPTFRDAIFFATGGSVLLPDKQPFSAQLDILGQELKAHQPELQAASTFVIAVDYEHINYGGATLVWEGTSPCTPDLYYYKNSMPSTWNDELSSTRGYSDCNRNILFEHINRQGGNLTCSPNCSSVGWMNDRTSSREWHHICEGSFCGNGRCDTSCGESSSTCPTDCPVCGNGVCEGGENTWNCCTDCSYCGNGVCDTSCGESNSSCPSDCPVCGNGLCESGEDSWSCPGDCGGGGSCGDGFCDYLQGGECTANCPQDCVDIICQ